MIVLVSNAHDVHADAVEAWLHEWQLSYLRFHPDELASRYEVRFATTQTATSFELVDRFSGKRCAPQQIKSVWFRRAQPPHVPDSSADDSNEYFFGELSAIVDAVYAACRSAYWINPLPNLSFANDKLAQLREAQRLGFRIPKTIVTNDPAKAYGFYELRRRACIVKPFRPTLVGGDIRVFTHRFESNLERSDFDAVTIAPTLLQEFVDKSSDLRVTVVGEEVFACRILSQTLPSTQVDFRAGDVLDIPHEVVHLPDSLRERVLRYAQRFGLPSCEFDFAEVSEGEPFFLECNPNGQWLWIEIMCRSQISRSVACLLAARAGQRVPGSA